MHNHCESTLRHGCSIVNGFDPVISVDSGPGGVIFRFEGEDEVTIGQPRCARNAFSMSIPPLSGSLKWAERSMLSLVISSVAGSLRIGASLLAFRMEMKISFSCTSGEVAGLGGVEREHEGGPRVAEAYDRGGERG